MKRILTAALAAVMVLTCCGLTAFAEDLSATETNGVTVCSLTPAKDSVEEFFMWLNDRQNIDPDRALLNDPETCWSLRSDAEALDLRIFKDSDTGATHLSTENIPAVKLTGNAGGLGVTSLAYGDLDQDGAEELYFTYSWEPEQYCAQAGYFDTKTAEVHYFGDYMCPDTELVFTAENGTLTVCKAAITSMEDKVHYELETGTAVAQIVCKNSQIEMESLSDDMIRMEQKLEPSDTVLPEWIPKSTAEAKAFTDENNQPVAKDGFVCYSVYISGADSYRANQICAAKRSDVKTPVSYRKYEDEYRGVYIVACFEMPPESYLEIYDSSSKDAVHYAYVSDKNGEITKVSKTDTADKQLYYFGIIGNETFQDMQILDDKGTLQYGVLNAYPNVFNEDTPYYLCTYHLDDYYVRNYVDSETGETRQETIHATGDPMYLVVPLSDVIRFVFRSGLDIDTAVGQATAIVQKYFPDTEPYYVSTNVYGIYIKDEAARTAEASESLMHDLAEAGLISAFYAWGETAVYLEVEHGYLTAYNPAEWEWAKQEYDWDAIEAWVETEHPECRFVCLSGKDSDLAKQLGIDNNRLIREDDTIYAVVPPEGTSFPEHYALAMELYEQFALTPFAYPTPKEGANPMLTGQNALAVAGDVDLSCSVDVADAVLLARFCAEDEEAVITEQGRINADFNKDGDITQDDVVLILQKIARLI